MNIYLPPPLPTQTQIHGYIIKLNNKYSYIIPNLKAHYVHDNDNDNDNDNASDNEISLIQTQVSTSLLATLL